MRRTATESGFTVWMRRAWKEKPRTVVVIIMVLAGAVSAGARMNGIVGDFFRILPVLIVLYVVVSLAVLVLKARKIAPPPRDDRIKTMLAEARLRNERANMAGTDPNRRAAEERKPAP